MPRVLLLHTGGTLGMTGGRPSTLKPGAFFKTLRARVPELKELADVELELFSNIDSCEMQPEHWSALATRLNARLSEFDGAVVTHGTDTLAFTASAACAAVGAVLMILVVKNRPVDAVPVTTA